MRPHALSQWSRTPEGAVVAVADFEHEGLALPVRGRAGGDDHGLAHGPALPDVIAVDSDSISATVPHRVRSSASTSSSDSRSAD